MCLAVPMQIVEILDERRGIVDLDGARYEARLDLIEKPRVGEYLIVHAGYAIEKLEQKEAEERLELFEQMAEMVRREEEGQGS